MTNAEARFNKSLHPRKPEGSLGRTAQGYKITLLHTSGESETLLTLHAVVSLGESNSGAGSWRVRMNLRPADSQWAELRSCVIVEVAVPLGSRP